jgi:TRAP-type C4-dicarboxylate transport system permease small subunit
MKLLKFEKIIDKFTFAISLISYVGIVAIMLLNVADVVMFKFFKKPIFGAMDLTSQLLLLTIIASFAYGQSQKAHINITLIISRIPRLPRFLLFGLMSILSTGTAVAMTYAAFLEIQSSMVRNKITEVLNWPMTPLYVVEFISLLALTIVLLFDTIMVFAAIKDDDIAKHVQSTWSD